MPAIKNKMNSGRTVPIFFLSLIFLCSVTILKVQAQGRWSRWSDCSTTCGIGYQTRRQPCGRRCTNFQHRECNTNRDCPCPSCSCSDDSRYVAFCTITVSRFAQLCRTYSALCQKSCNRCPPCNNCGPTYGRWRVWGKCTRTCGGGLRYRYRNCNKRGGCPGQYFQKGFCSTRTCRAPAPTPTRSTQPPRTLTTRAPTGGCNPGKRKWGKCRGNPAMQSTTDSCRPIQTRACSEGRVIATVFSDNFISPPMVDGPTTGQGGSQGGGGVTGRRFQLGQVKPDSSGGTKGNQSCTVVNHRNARGEIIFGSCRKDSPSGGGSGRKKRQIMQTKRDLLIMMDESGSVGRRRFEKVKRIAAAIVRLLCDAIAVNQQYTRVTIASFDFQWRIHIKLFERGGLSYTNNDADRLANYIIRRIRYNSRTARQTCLLRALDSAYNQALDSSNGGRRGRPDVEQDIIIISDGCEYCNFRREYRLSQTQIKERIVEQSQFFIRQEIHVYVIGIGLRDRCKDVLSLLAQGGRCFHFFYLTRWDYEVDDFLNELENPPDDVCLNVFESPLMQCLDPLG